MKKTEHTSKNKSKSDYYYKSNCKINNLSRPKLLSVIAHFDLPDSTKHLVKKPHKTITKMLKHNHICTQLIKKHGGVPIKELGDAVLAEFMFYPQAILCAKEAITYLKNSQCKICTKVSITVGRIEKIKTNKIPDVYGIPVNLCSRMSEIVKKNSIIVEEKRKEEWMPLLENISLTLGTPKEETFRGFESKNPICIRQIKFN